MGTVIIFILLLSLLVFVHELGHFWTAKKMGMDVEEFGFGFPPRAWGKKIGGTLYSINWLPLGGFVKIKGENGELREEEGSFASKKPWRRVVVLSAGVVMNFLLAALLLSFGFMFGLPQALDGVDTARVQDAKVQIIDVVEGLPASQAELHIGDVIRQINETPIVSSQDLIQVIDENTNKTVTVTLERGEETLIKDVDVVFFFFFQRGIMGVELIEIVIVSYRC